MAVGLRLGAALRSARRAAPVLVRPVSRGHSSGAGGSDLHESRALFDKTLTELRESEAVRRAKELWRRAREDIERQNAALLGELGAKTEGVRRAAAGAAGAIGGAIARPARAIAQALPDVSDTAVARGVRAAEERALEATDAYAYGGFRSAEARARVAARLAEEAAPAVPADPDAGAALVPVRARAGVRLGSGALIGWAAAPLCRVLAGARASFRGSNNVFVHFARALVDRLHASTAGLLFAETEAARALGEILRREPGFSAERHLRGVRDVLLPAVAEAYVQGDVAALRPLCTDAAFRVLSASVAARVPLGCRAEGAVLDMRGVELAATRLLEDGTPVLVYTAAVQQTAAVRRAADGAVVSGAPDAIESLVYVLAFALPEAGAVKSSGAADSALSRVLGGWRLAEMAVRDRNAGW